MKTICGMVGPVAIRTLAVICLIIPHQGFCSITANHPAVTVSSNISVFVDHSEADPIHRAVKDLIRDFTKIFGSQPQIISSLDNLPEDLPVIVVTCKGELTKHFRDPKLTDFESHLIKTCQMANRKAVVLQGADMRGTIYSIYTFSEKFLEIPPLWIWSSYQPEMKKQIEIPAGTNLYFPSPYVKWRAWFPNDQDLITPWQEKNDQNYDAPYETMLRLKMNTFEFVLNAKNGKAGKAVRHARDRGLKVSFTHTSPFGANFSGWDAYWKNINNQDPPALSVRNVEALKEFWLYNIKTIQKEKMDVIWQLGFRSSGDNPFWETFADSPVSDVERAKVIESMIREQVDLLKKTIGDDDPLMKITFYNESSDFLAAGLLKLPDEPTLIWSFVAARRDHFPASDIRNITIPDQQLTGYYMNFQFTSSGSHLAAAEGPWKMEKNFRFVDGKSKMPLAFSVVNAGNTREHVRELSANAAMMWDFHAYNTDDFMKAFCRTYFGEKYAEDIAGLYKDFYDSYWNPKASDLPGFDRQYIFHDMRYARAIEDFVKKWDLDHSDNPLDDKGLDTGGRYYRIVPEDNDADNQLGAVIKGTQESIVKLQDIVSRADAISQKISPHSRTFFDDDLRLQAVFMLELNKTLNSLVHAYIAKESDPLNKYSDHIEMALKSATKLRDIKRESEHGRFEDWYETDRLFKMDGLREKIESIKKTISIPDFPSKSM